MKIFIPSWRRPTSTSTPELLKASGFNDFKLVVRSNEFKAYAKVFNRRNLMAIGEEEGLNIARERARAELRNGEWCVMMDDNIRWFIQAQKKFYSKNIEIVLRPGEKMITRQRWQKVMCEEVTFKAVMDLAVADTLKECDKRGAWLAGFAAHENPAFRGKKFTDVGYVNGKMMLMRNQGLPWAQSTESAGEDYALTAAHLYRNGRVLINKWMHPFRYHYQPGGCGPYLERLPAMIRAQKELTQRYGDLFGIKNEGRELEGKKQGELRVRFNSLDQVAIWRLSMPRNPNWSSERVEQLIDELSVGGLL